MPEKIFRGKLVIRAAKPKDIEAIKEMVWKGVFERGTKTTVNLDKTTVFVALHENKIVGFCKCGERTITQKGTKRKKKEGFIAMVEVAKKFQKNEIRHKLIGKAHSLFEKRGLKASRIFTLTKSKGFLQKAGYQHQQGFGTVTEMKRISPNARRRRL